VARRPSRERRGKYTTVSIPTPLFERIKALIEGQASPACLSS